jgi:pyridoxine 5-phosphate synthase
MGCGTLKTSFYPTMKNRALLKLGVNVDHVATVRQARYRKVTRGMRPEPDPLEFARAAARAGAHGITAHLREDRRHMQEADLRALRTKIALPLNLEMAVTRAMVLFAAKLRPAHACLVPENRQEITTEGGLAVAGHEEAIGQAVRALKTSGIIVSLFIDPEADQVQAAAATGSPFIELHTGQYANASTARTRGTQLRRLIRAAHLAHELGLQVNAGHGLHYDNLGPFLKEVPHLVELNIGHSIVARALSVGAEQAVREMLDLMQNYSG